MCEYKYLGDAAKAVATASVIPGRFLFSLSPRQRKEPGLLGPRVATGGWVRARTKRLAGGADQSLAIGSGRARDARADRGARWARVEGFGLNNVSFFFSFLFLFSS
jgi:hypothetical protein